MDLADYTREFVECLAAGLYEGRYPLAVPVEWRKACVEYSLKVLQLPRQQASFHLRETAYEGVVIFQHEVHVLDVLVVLILLKCHI